MAKEVPSSVSYEFTRSNNVSSETALPPRGMSRRHLLFLAVAIAAGGELANLLPQPPSAPSQPDIPDSFTPLVGFYELVRQKTVAHPIQRLNPQEAIDLIALLVTTETSMLNAKAAQVEQRAGHDVQTEVVSGKSSTDAAKSQRLVMRSYVVNDENSTYTTDPLAGNIVFSFVDKNAMRISSVIFHDNPTNVVSDAWSRKLTPIELMEWEQGNAFSMPGFFNPKEDITTTDLEKMIDVATHGVQDTTIQGLTVAQIHSSIQRP